MLQAGNKESADESFQARLWHLIVSHQLFMKQKGKWESVEKTK